MKMVDSFLTRNPCYIAKKPLKADGVVIGMVGCPQPGPKVFINNWDRNSACKVCPHVLVGTTGDNVYKTLPYEYCGIIGRSEINTSKIGVLLCEPNQIKYRGECEFDIPTNKDKAIELIHYTYWQAVKACAEVCKELNFDPMIQVKSYSEWTESAISARDPDTFWNRAGVELDMDEFRKDVADCMMADPSTEDAKESVQEEVVDTPVEEPMIQTEPEVAVEEVTVQTESEVAVAEETIVQEEPDPAPQKPTYITIKIDVPNLRIRKGPGNGPGCEPIGRYTGVGTFQISEIQNGSGSNTGWGKLTTGDGWVSMDFVEIIE